MRSSGYDAADTTLWEGGSYETFPVVAIEDADGTFQEVTDRLLDFSVDQSVDQPITGARIRLHGRSYTRELIQNGEFRAGSSAGWTAAVDVVGSSSAGVPDGAPSAYVGELTQGTGGAFDSAFAGYYAAVPGDVFVVEAWVAGGATLAPSTSDIDIGARAYDTEGGNFSVLPAATGEYTVIGTTWTKITGTVTVPATVSGNPTTLIRPFASVGTETGGTGSWYFTKFSVRKVGGNLHPLNTLSTDNVDSGGSYAALATVGREVKLWVNVPDYIGTPKYRTNELLYSHDISNAYWTTSGVAKSAATSIFADGTAQDVESLGTGARAITRPIGTLSGSPETLSVIVEGVDAVVSDFGIYDDTTNAFVNRVRLTWATGAVASIASTGGSDVSQSVVSLGTGPNGGDLYRVSVRGTADNPGNDRTVWLYPEGQTGSAGESFIIHHVQLEEHADASSPIITGATNSADVGESLLIFDGVIDEVSARDDNSIELICRDKIGADLADSWVEAVTQYGTPSGASPNELLEDVIQEIIDDNTTLTPTLYVPGGSTSFAINEYNQQRQNVWTACQTVADLIGYKLEPRWRDSTGQFELTLYEPDRATSTVDFTHTPDAYVSVDVFGISRLEVRNVVKVSYTDSGGTRQSYTATDASSITRYGRLWMEIEEADDSPIDTAGEAQTMADAALADLAEPTALHAIRRFCFPIVQLGDYYTIAANDREYDSDQSLAVTSFRHEGTANHVWTTIELRGKPSSGTRQWLRRSSKRFVENEDILSNTVTANELDVDNLGEVSTNLGTTISTGRVEAANLALLDLDASGTDNVLAAGWTGSAYALRITANGTIVANGGAFFNDQVDIQSSNDLRVLGGDVIVASGGTVAVTGAGWVEAGVPSAYTGSTGSVIFRNTGGTTTAVLKFLDASTLGIASAGIDFEVPDELTVGGAATLSSTLNVTGATTLSGTQITGDLELDGALNHDGSTVGFYGTTPIAQQSAVSAPSLSSLSGLDYSTEASTISSNLTNLQTAINAIRTRLSNIGITS